MSLDWPQQGVKKQSLAYEAHSWMLKLASEWCCRSIGGCCCCWLGLSLISTTFLMHPVIPETYFPAVKVWILGAPPGDESEGEKGIA